MKETIIKILSAVSDVYNGWILWNLFLAFIPLALSFWLYRRRMNPRSTFWWIGFLVFIAFLPNAPYMLTDIIHLIRGTREVSSVWTLTLIVIPTHVVAILGGFEAYVVSLINQAHYLKRQGIGQFVLISELLCHALCAVGIYLGRFRRFNSWDLVTDPSYILTRTVDDLTSKRPFVVMAITFMILTVLYWLIKQITIGLMLRIRFARKGIDVLG